MTRSNSIATDRAHSLENEKMEKLERLKSPDNAITLSWNDVSGNCSKPGCQGKLSHACQSSQLANGSLTVAVRQKGHRHSIPGQLLRLYNFSDFHQFGSPSASLACKAYHSKVPPFQQVPLRVYSARPSLAAPQVHPTCKTRSWIFQVSARTLSLAHIDSRPTNFLPLPPPPLHLQQVPPLYDL